MPAEFVVPLKRFPSEKVHSHNVYRYMCSNCKVTYYGKTYRHLFTRAAEHMGISNLTRNMLNVSNNQQCLTIYLNVIIR